MHLSFYENNVHRISFIMKELCVGQPVSFGFYSRPPHFCRTVRIQDSTRNRSHHHPSSGKALLSASADFGSPWTGGMQALHSDTPHKILNCTMTPLPGTAVPPWSPTNVAAIINSNWPPFNFSGHGGIGSGMWK